jgi:small subunit ribosomal protein S9
MTALISQFPLWAVGRRKNAVARVRLIPGNGKLTVNSKTLNDYFTGHDRSKFMAMRPLEAAKVGSKYDLIVDVKGGGVYGQAEAVSHGVARVLSLVDSTIRQTMRKEGLLTRDPRMVERKKPGRPKARARFQYSKR